MGKLGELLKKLLDFIIGLLMKIYNNPTAREMAMSALQTAVDAGINASDFVLEKVKEANELPLTSAEKYDYVVAKCKEHFADLPMSFLNQLIENALGSINKNK